MVPCQSRDRCEWDSARWRQEVTNGAAEKAGEEPESIIAREHLPRGFTAIPDRRYILRPEAIESVFSLYRATGRADLVESAWTMFEAIDKSTSTALANSAVSDVTILDEELH